MKRMLYILLWLLPLLPARASNELYLSDVFFSSQRKGDLSLYITNASEVTAFQLELDLPDGVACTGAVLSERAAADHTVAVSQRPDGSWFVGCWSMTNRTFALDRGCICTLHLACDGGVAWGSHGIGARTMLFFPDGGRVTGTAAAVGMVGTGSADGTGGIWMPEQSFCQAWRITHGLAGLLLQGDAKKGQLVAVKQTDADDDEGTFFLEPALDLDGNRFYLRSLTGRYLSSVSGKGNTLSDGAQGGIASLAMTETGEGVYGFCLGSDGRGEWLTLQSDAAGTPVTSGSRDARVGWRLEASHAPCPREYVEHLMATAATNVGLTGSSADIELRLTLHDVRRWLENPALTPDADSLTRRLYAAAKAARRCYLDGDTSTAVVPWGAPEAFPPGEYAVYVEDERHKVHFLSADGGGELCLTDMPSAFDTPVKDIFYNPVTDRYAIRLTGGEDTEEGCYVAFAGADSPVGYAARSAGEALRVWNIMPLAEAIGRFMTVKGKCGTNIAWRFEAGTGTLVLTGSGRTTYYPAAENTPWYPYRSRIRHVVLAGDIQQLGSWLLAGCTALSRLTVTARTPAGFESTTFDDVPAGLQILALYPANYTRFLEGCETHYLATMQEEYTYTGKPAVPVCVCDFPATVQARSMGTVVGEYATSASFTVTIEGQRYTFTANSSYRIVPAGIIATTREYTRSYGAANPNFYVVLDGFLGKDDEASVVQTRPTASCTADKMSPVGEYAITFSGGELKDPNYTWDYRPSVLRVNEARLMVIADDATRLQGEANPAFTFHCSGFVNGEDESVFTSLPVLTTDADEQSAPGKYYITVSGGCAPNYSLRYYSGILTVEPSAGLLPLRADEVHPAVYDLMGRPVEAPHGQPSRHGIYIVDGKKTMKMKNEE